MQLQHEAPHMEFPVKQYMFCHPDSVVIRRGRPKLLRWQHLIGTQDLILQLKHSRTGNSVIEGLGLYLLHLTLESIQPLAVAIEHHSLRVAWHDAWLAFKWTTRRGNTQFQIKLPSPANARQIAHRLRRSGCSVDAMESDLLRSERVFDEVRHAPDSDAAATFDAEPDNNTAVGYDWSTLQSPGTQIAFSASQQETQTATPGSLRYSQCYSQCYSQRCSQQTCSVPHQIPGGYHSTPRDWGPDPNQTQFSATQYPCQAPSVVSFVSTSPSVASGATSMPAYSVDGISISASMPSRLESFFGSGSYCGSVTFDLRWQQRGLARKLDIAKLVKRRRALNLVPKTYSFSELCKARGGRKEGTKWFHVGLVSGLCLSLVPATGPTAQPLVVLSRGSNILAEFVPHPRYLLAYCSEDILGLLQHDSVPGTICGHVQLHMNAVHVEAACEWLRYWGISANIDGETAPATESTRLNSAWSRPLSASTTATHGRPRSRASRHSVRHLRKLERPEQPRQSGAESEPL